MSGIVRLVIGTLYLVSILGGIIFAIGFAGRFVRIIHGDNATEFREYLKDEVVITVRWDIIAAVMGTIAGAISGIFAILRRL